MFVPVRPDAGPSEFSLVNFRIPTSNGDAMVNITPLAGMSGRDALIVNMWREQVGQPPLDDATAAASFTPVDIGGACLMRRRPPSRRSSKR